MPDDTIFTIPEQERENVNIKYTSVYKMYTYINVQCIHSVYIV